MSTLADSPVGKPLLWLLAIGLIALAVWQAAEIFRWRSGWSASGKTRTKAIRKSGNALIKAVIYAALAVLAIKFAIGSGKSSSQKQQQTTAAACLVACRPMACRGRGAGAHRLRHLARPEGPQEDVPQADRHLEGLAVGAEAGHPARPDRLPRQGRRPRRRRRAADLGGDHVRPLEGQGLDGAMHAILDLPFGEILLTLVALGIAAFGAFLFVRARYPERT